jgi:hypothetical protein
MQSTEPVADFHVPAPHGMQAVPSAPVYPARQVQIELFTPEKVLFGHALHFEAAADEYVFASHGVHIPAPVLALYVPAAQFVQSTEPETDFHVPTPQGVHTVPSAPVYPATQVQIELFADEKVFTPQGVHVVLPVTFLYVPAPQGVHAAPSAPVYPAMQVQIKLLSADNELARHGEQVSNAIAVVAVEKVFAAHGVQIAEPVADFHVPTPQGVHSVPSAPVYPARQVQIKLLSADNELARHGEQVSNAIAVVAVEKVFTAHGVQSAEPVADFHVPTPQGVHAAPSAPVYPARQVQIELFTVEMVLFGHIEQVAAAADEYVFTPHDLQSIELVTFLYVPASQGVHAVPPEPVYPAMQVQIELLSSEKVLVGHVEQSTAAADE